MRYTERMRVWLFPVLCVFFVYPLVLSAQNAEEIRKNIQDQKSKLDAINREIAAYESQLVEIGGKKQTLQTAVNGLDISVKRTQAKVRAKQGQIATTELEIQQLTGEIVGKEEVIKIESDAIAGTIRKLREAEDYSLVEMLLGSKNVGELWGDTEVVRTIQDSMRMHVDSLEEAREVLAEDRDEAQIKRELLVTQKDELAEEERSLAVQKKEQQGLLSRTKNQEANYQKLLADKRAARAAFESALSDLESKLQYTLDPSRLPSVGKGILRWPLDNVFITQQFGRTADSGRLYVSGTHNGVDFRASIGTPIKSALAGTVQGTGNTDAIAGCYSYGKWILIKHGNGLSTLYAHLSDINVSEGQSISTGQVIGYSGFTGYATGPHLHFTVFASDAVQIRKLSSGKGCNNAVIPVSAASGYLNPLDYL